MVESLHDRALRIAAAFHKAESDLIDVLQKIDDARLFSKLGFTSLFDYATKALKLSEANASNFVAIARKSKTIPELKVAIADGRITVSKARKITPVLTKENSDHWLELAATLPKAKLEREVARVMPETLVQDKIRPVAESRMELKMGLDEKTADLFKRAQDLVSQRTSRPATYEETLAEILKFYLDRNDPLEKAKRSENKEKASKEKGRSAKQAMRLNEPSSDAAASVPGQKLLRQNRIALAAKTEHQVTLRDDNRCTAIDSVGQRCESRRWLEVHHKISVEIGGTNANENLQTLCHAHHRMRH